MDRFEQDSANAIFLRGKALYDGNKYDEALSCFTDALNLSEKLNLRLLKADCLERMASLHLATDDPHLALKLYFESLVIYEKINNQPGIAKVYNVLGFYNTDRGEYDTAKFYLNKALNINRKYNNKHNIIANKGNLGYLFECKGDLVKAEKIYLELVSYLVENHDRQDLPVIYYNLSSLYQKRHDLPQAMKYIRLAISISEKDRNTSLLSTLYGNTGEMFLISGRSDSAMKYLQRSVACAREIDDAETEIQALSFIAKLDSASGDFRSFHTVIQRILSLKDTVYRKNLENSMKSSELNYDNSRKQSLIEAQQQILKANQRERWLYMLVIIVSVIAGIFLVRIIVMGKRQYLKNIRLNDQEIKISNLEVERLKKNEEINHLKMEKIKDEIRIKERDLVTIALQIEQKNELLDFVGKKIKEFAWQKDGFDPVNLCREIDQSIRIQQNDTENSNMFNERFSQIHQDFFTNLRNKHPELSKTELKFCAYLRIHLSTSQIATILNVTVEAIRKNRYRIRKKMGLAARDSLENYISKF